LLELNEEISEISQPWWSVSGLEVNPECTEIEGRMPAIQSVSPIIVLYILRR
jgi:hypothetical protein